MGGEEGWRLCLCKAAEVLATCVEVLGEVEEKELLHEISQAQEAQNRLRGMAHSVLVPHLVAHIFLSFSLKILFQSVCRMIDMFTSQVLQKCTDFPSEYSQHSPRNTQKQV